MSPEQPAPTFARRGPFLELSPGVWVDARTVVRVSPGFDGEGSVGTLCGHRGGSSNGASLDVQAPAPAVVEAVTDALLDWAREEAIERERGRLMALDAQELPVRGEDPFDPFPTHGSPWP